MQSLKYQPLPTGTASIRMLALLPAKLVRSQVKTELIHVDLDRLEEAPFEFYNALSYTWGDPSLPRVLCKLNGHEHTITTNLELALKRLRGPTRKHYLWVDALCINQNDVTKRASQVQIMRRIYESAEQVLVWLGGDADDSPTAIRLMKKFTGPDCPRDFVERSILDQKDLAQWKAVAKLFGRDWFTRVWVRQEVAVAKEIMVMCGKERIRWNTLIVACYYLTCPEIGNDFDNVAIRETNRSPGTLTAVTLESIRQTWAKNREINLATLLIGHGLDTGVTDARDRVYGLLGLSDIADKFKVDYTVSPQEVYKSAMITMLNHQQDLNPLSMCQWCSDVTGLPSWVFNVNGVLDAMPLRSKEDGEQLYHTAGEQNACFDFIEPPGLLRASGFLYDTVHAVEETFPSGDAGEIRQCFENWLQLAVKTASLRPSGVADNELMQEFCRTLTADQDDRGDRATIAFCRPYFEGETLTTLPAKLAEAYVEEFSALSTRVTEVCAERLILGTSKGYIGVAHKACKPRDVICILLGAGVPLILRRRASEYILIGEAYIHGIMDGEAIKELERESVLPTSITLC